MMGPFRANYSLILALVAIVTLIGCKNNRQATPPEVKPASRTAPDRGPNIDTLLMTAIADNNIAVVKELVGRGANVNTRDASGFTALVNAMAASHMEIVDILIANGAETGIERPDEDRAATISRPPITPAQTALNDQLIKAVEAGDFGAVKKLIATGADLNAMDESGFTVLVVGIANYDRRIVEYLVTEGAMVKPPPPPNNPK